VSARKHCILAYREWHVSGQDVLIGHVRCSSCSTGCEIDAALDVRSWQDLGLLILIPQSAVCGTLQVGAEWMGADARRRRCSIGCAFRLTAHRKLPLENLSPKPLLLLSISRRCLWLTLPVTAMSFS
jgi:hypothetical protein